MAMALIALVFALNVYRAAIQSCTVDEATTYNNFASKSVTEIFTLPYDANNQILHTILCRWAVRTFGVSELALRIPSLLGGLLFLAMSYRLCRLYFGRGWLFLAVLCGLAINPLTLDFLSIARGYGLAAGLFLVACDQLSRHLLEPAWNPRRLTRASFALGMATAANLTFSIPAIALVLVFLHLEMWERRRLRFWDAVNQLIVPGTVAAAVLLILPLIRAARGDFYFGANSVQTSIESMAFPALVHHATPLAAFGRWLAASAPLLLGIAAILLVAAILFAARGGPDTFPRRMPIQLTGGALAVSCAMLLAAHTATGMLYPLSRTGLYLVVLFTFGLGSLAAYTRAAVSILAAPILLLFALQLTAGPYSNWVFDSGTKTIVNRIRADMARTGAVNVRIAAGHFLQPSLNFYRRRYHLNGVARVEENSLANPADYYVLLPQDGPVVNDKHLEILYRDPVSLQVLAKPQAIH
jgi:uncharacterized membrane protein